MEELILNLIMHSGQARSSAVEAISLAKKEMFDKADEFLKKADEELGFAHNAQTSLIQAENDEIQVSLLLVHAEDHLMTTMTFKDLAAEFVELYKRLSKKSLSN